MVNKRGLSHVEFVISFIIFIAFLLFSFIFFNPLNSGRTLKSSMDYAWIEVTNLARMPIETYSVVIDPRINAPQVALQIEVPSDYYAFVEDIDGKSISSYMDDNKYVHFKRPDDNFVKIKYSSAFTNGVQIIGDYLEGEDYKISSSKIEELYFESKFIELKDRYFEEYLVLKNEINLPNRIEFGFIVDFSDDTPNLDSLNEIPEDYEVLSKNDRIEVIRNSGKREYADLRIFVW